MCSPSAGEPRVSVAGVRAELRRVAGQARPPDDVMVVHLEQPDRDRVRIVGKLGGREDHRERHALGLEARGRVGHACVFGRVARSTGR